MREDVRQFIIHSGPTIGADMELCCFPEQRSESREALVEDDKCLVCNDVVFGRALGVAILIGVAGAVAVILARSLLLAYALWWWRLLFAVTRLGVCCQQMHGGGGGCCCRSSNWPTRTKYVVFGSVFLRAGSNKI
nr:hypothetical protein Iba_chr05dCG8190 [Ipomoea batatas]